MKKIQFSLRSLIIALLIYWPLSGCSNLTNEVGNKLLINNPAPDFALRTPNGKLIKLGDYQGKPVFVNFWTTWCGPCRAEMPDIQKVADKYKAKGLVVIGINEKELYSDVESYAKELNLGFTLLLDDSGKVGESYRVHSFPSSYFISNKGIIKQTHIGTMTIDELEQAIELIID